MARSSLTVLALLCLSATLRCVPALVARGRVSVDPVTGDVELVGASTVGSVSLWPRSSDLLDSAAASEGQPALAGPSMLIDSGGDSGVLDELRAVDGAPVVVSSSSLELSLDQEHLSVDSWAPDISNASFDPLRDQNQQQSNAPFQDTGAVVVRRGATLAVALRWPWKTPPDGLRYSVLLISEQGDQTSLAKLSATRKSGSASVVISGTVPAGSLAGVYQAVVSVASVSNTAGSSKTLETSFVVLFNAWDPRDAAYCADDTLRQRYLLSQQGTVFLESESVSMAIQGWNYKQFDKIALDALRWLMHSWTQAERGSPVLASRRLTQQARHDESQDTGDQGILVGQWSANKSVYGDGVDPTLWRDTTEILSLWRLSGHKPVGYGQCWVFSALLTTLLRSCGIVGRQVMAKPCAHNPSLSMQTRLKYTNDGLRTECEDMWWNFHNWNEAWLSNTEWTGSNNASQWNMLDPTYRLGPVPRPAIVKGVNNSEASFVRMEVGAVLKYVYQGSVLSMINPDDESSLVAQNITGSYRRQFPKQSTVYRGVTVPSYSVDALATPSTFSYTVQSSTQARIRVHAVVSVAPVGVECNETLGGNQTDTVDMSPGEPFKGKATFSWDRSASSSAVLWFRLFITNLDTGVSALWLSVLAPSSLGSLLFRY
eukprot:m51a1_g1488 putative protein-glutamine gamma-glutamyltransferase 2 (656) ;mRNA; f:312904-315053